MPPTWGRTVAEWQALLGQLGFTVQAVPMSQGTPFANVLLVADLATRAIRIPSGETTRVQEMHALCLHALAAAVDRALGGAPPGGVPSP